MQLRGDFLAQEGDQLLDLERRGEAGGAAVSAAALGAGDRGHVDVVVGRAQRDLALAAALGAVSSRTSAATLVPCTARRMSTMPSE